LQAAKHGNIYVTYRILTTQITETTAPVIEPVGLEEMKVHCRVDGNDHDTILNVMIKAARGWCENYLQRSLVQRTYRADVEGFASRYALPLPPLSSVSSIKYYTPDSPQVLTTLDADFYRADLGRGEIYIDASSGSIPSIASRHDAVQITYVAGYEPTTDSPQDLAGNVPEAIKSAIKLQAADLFENREVNTQLRMQELPTVKWLLMGYRVL
jgi:uncharacterized phiE125 gp8 family phage protein